MSEKRKPSMNRGNVLKSSLAIPTGGYLLGNGLSGGYAHDKLGRQSGGWVRQGGNPTSCPSDRQRVYVQEQLEWDRIPTSFDSVLGQKSSYGYDEFDRLTSRTVTSGTAQNFTWVYDRWGNRAQQNVTAGTGPTPNYAFNTATNQIQGYGYDAAGNMTNDGFHSYTYDAEGKVMAVGTGTTVQYVYDALNHRVRTVVNGTAVEFVFNQDGILPLAQHRAINMCNNNLCSAARKYLSLSPQMFYQGILPPPK